MLVYLHNYESAPNYQWTKIAKLSSFKEITKIFNDKHLRYKMRFPYDHRNNVWPHLCARSGCSHADINFVKAQHFHAFAYQSYQRFFLSIIFKFLYILRPVCTGERIAETCTAYFYTVSVFIASHNGILKEGSLVRGHHPLNIICFNVEKHEIFHSENTHVHIWFI